jgi:ABC-type multidrug transport system fused ATPase/permease subunit
LGVRLQLLGAIITTCLGVTILIISLYSIIDITPSIAGLSLLYSFTLVNNLNSFLNSFSETEQEMISVERVLEYASLDDEFAADDDGDDDDDKEEGPTSNGDDKYDGMRRRRRNAVVKVIEGSLTYGQLNTNDDDRCVSVAPGMDAFIHESNGRPAVEFINVSMKYQKGGGIQKTEALNADDHGDDGGHGGNGDADALKEINTSIAAGSCVAIVGRTGSGKSSLLRVLMRLNDYYAGTVRINGVDLLSISKKHLRGSIAIIPQKPVLFSGTIQFNLDPSNVHTIDELLVAFDRCRYPRTVAATTTTTTTTTAATTSTATSAITLGQQAVHSREYLLGLMQYELTDGGSNISIGQQQLLCLARAFLRRSSLILIDEATAAIDSATEELLYTSLKEYVTENHATLLMVCHKLQSVHIVCDKVCINMYMFECMYGNSLDLLFTRVMLFDMM